MQAQRRAQEAFKGDAVSNRAGDTGRARPSTRRHVQGESVCSEMKIASDPTLKSRQTITEADPTHGEAGWGGRDLSP